MRERVEGGGAVEGDIIIIKQQIMLSFRQHRQHKLLTKTVGKY